MEKMMKMAIAAAMVMTMSANAIAASKVSGAAPAECSAIAKSASGVEVREVISYETDKVNKFVYTLDAEGNVLSKTMYYASYSNKDSWKPVYSVNASYGAENNAFTYAAWNEKEGAFTSTPRTLTYGKEDTPVLMEMPDNCAF